jgi:hypothetical protein
LAYRVAPKPFEAEPNIAGMIIIGWHWQDLLLKITEN